MTTSDATLQMPAELTVYHVTQLRTQLADALDQGSVNPIDLSGVIEIDSAGVQVLLVARREAATRGVALCFVSPSAPVREVFATLSLSLEKDL